MNLPWRHIQASFGGRTISTSLTAAEASELRAIAAQKRVLEIGSAYGFSSIIMSQVADEVVSVDHHQHMNSFSAMAANVAAYNAGHKIEMHQGSSRDILPHIEPGKFDVAFIDGDHTYDGVVFDATECRRLVVAGGLIAFHDYGEDSCPEVRKALDELYRDGPLKLVDTLFIVRN